MVWVISCHVNPARGNGLIAFYGILPPPDFSNMQVNRRWDRLRDNDDTEEIGGHETAGSKIGIGLLRQ
jgi:hypothetical protein